MEEETLERKSKKKKKTVQQKKKKKNKKGDDLEDKDEQDLPLQLTGQFSNLSTDIFMEILSRLPLKSLCNCKYVSKAWFNLIYHSPTFANMHYTISLQNGISPCVLIFDRFKDFHLIDHEVFDNRQTWASVFKVELREFQEGEFQIVGSVNGLLCFSPHADYFSPTPYYICNPITREHLILPSSPKNKRCPAVSGFGFDSTTNEYKVIRILQTLKSSKAKAEVFTLGSGSWRQIPVVPYISDKTPSNVLVNGCLHWLTKENSNLLVIVSFAVGTEEFRVISLPPCANSNQKDKLNYIGALGGCLSFVQADLSAFWEKNEIWVMKEYGSERSWVKEYLFRKEVMSSPWKGGYEITKLADGNFLLQYEGKRLGYYDPHSETFKSILIQNNRRLREGFVRAIVQAGSIISPKNVGGLVRR